MGNLELTAAVDHCIAAAALLKLHLAGRLVQAVELAGGVGAPDKLPRQLHAHPIVQSQSRLRYAHALVEAVLDEEVYEGALACRSKAAFVEKLDDLLP